MASSRLLALLLCLSAADALNFTSVFEWNQLDFNWPSEEFKKDAGFKPANIYPLYLAVSGQRLFLSLRPARDAPATLAWLPNQHYATQPSPKLNAYPSWDLQKKEDCNAMQAVRGIAADSVNRLWALDNGDVNCLPKLWIFDLADDSKQNVYQFPSDVSSGRYVGRNLHDLVIDEDNWHAYISATFNGTDHLVVFSLKDNTSWRVATQDKRVSALALSPTATRERLYVSERNGQGLYTISTPELRSGARSVALTLVGTKSAPSNRMTMDAKGVLYFDLISRDSSVAAWDTNSHFEEAKVFQDKKLNNDWPFTFVSDSKGDIWTTVRYFLNVTQPFKILKAAGCVLTKSCQRSVETGTTPVPVATKRVVQSPSNRPCISQHNAESENKKSIWIVVLIFTNVLSLAACGVVFACLIRRQAGPHASNVVYSPYRNFEPDTVSVISIEPGPSAPAKSPAREVEPHDGSAVYRNVQ